MSAGRRDNPYVGPRPLRAGERLYGRDRELARLFDLLLAERIVLLYSPSGAGKSSLLQAGLLPRLRGEGFAVRPVVRLGVPPPSGAPPGVNRHVLSTLLSLEEDVPRDRQQGVAALAGRSLAEYLRGRRAADADADEVIVLDQFEEVLTVDPTDIAGKAAFFGQLGEALRDAHVWLIAAMREDYIAGLDPYRAALPGKLRTTFRLDLLGRAAALAAVQGPALAQGVTFRDDAAAQLVDDLRLVRVQRQDGGVDTLPGPHVEPVQLQVVCRGLWAALPADERTIGRAHLAAQGDVDEALARYFDATVAAAARAAGVPERALRLWIGRHLVTGQGLRTQVLQTPEATHGLANAAVTALVDAHLLRTDTRRGMTWLELAHDRIVAPLLTSNAAWTAANLSPMQRQAELWDSGGRPDALLLASAAEAEALAAEACERTASERLFLAQSVAVRRREEAAARNLRLLRVLAATLAAIVVIGLVIGLVTLAASGRAALADAERRARERGEAAERAVAEQRAAEAALLRQLVAQVALRRDQQPELAALLALAAARRLDDPWQRKAALLSALVTQPQLVTRMAPAGADAAAYTQIAAQGDGLVALDRRGQLVRLGPAERGGAPALPAGTRAGDFAAHPRRATLAIARDGAVELWDAGAAAPAARIELPADPPDLGDAAPADAPAWIEGLRFSADGRVLAAVRVRADGVARGFLIDAETHAVTALKGRLSAPAIGLSPDGQVAVVGMLDATIKVFTRPTLAPRVYAADHPGAARVSLARFDPFAPRLLTGGEGAAATLWTLRGGVPGDPRPLHLLDDGDLLDAMFLADGSLVALTETWISVWRGEPLAPWGTPIAAPTRRMTTLAALGADGQIAAASAIEAPIHVFDPQRLAPWSAAPPRPPTTLGGDTRFHGAVAQVALDRAGRRILVTEFDGVQTGRVKLLAAEDRSPIAEATVTGEQFVAVTLAGADRALLVDAAGALTAWTIGEPPRTLVRLTQRPHQLALTSDPAGQAVVAGVAYAATTVTVAREADGFVPRTIDAGAKITAVALDRAGGRVAVATCAERLSFAACTRGEIRVHSLAGGPAPAALQVDAKVQRLTFAGDGTRLAAVVDGGPPAVWDLRDGRRIALTGRRTPGQFLAADFSSDGEVLLASAEAQHAAVQLTLWDLRTGEELAPPLLAHHPAVGVADERLPRTVLLAGDGGLAISSSFDGVLLWDLRDATLERRACTLAGRTLTAAEWARFLGPGAAPEPLCPPP